MASIYSLDKQVASLPKHGFPMSQVFDFTASTGMILPIYYDRLNPGEKFRYQVDLFTRTQPLSTPANVEIDEFVDVFFVPLKKLSAVADNILFQIDDVPSTFFKDGFTMQSSGYMFPLLDTSKIGCGDDSTDSTYLPSFDSYVLPYGISPFFDTYIKGAMRLFDHLGLDPTRLIDSAPATSLFYSPKVSPEFLGVYQAIYYDYFRLSNWESNQIAAYNFDNAYDTMELLSSGKSWAAGPSTGTLKYLIQLHYRARNKDYFTNVFPSPLIGNSGMLSSGIQNLNSVNQWLVYNNFSPIDVYGAVNNSGNADSVSVSDTLTSVVSDNSRLRVSTANLRTLFAVDKLLKVTGRAGKHYDDQVLAHFGFKVPRGFDGEVMHLGNHHQSIKIGEVISTASTSTGELGELAGKGYSRGVNQLVDNFVAPCHGYIMAVYSCAPKVSYVGGLDRLHTDVLRYNWFIPELDNLGMQPIFSYEQSIRSNSTATNRYAWSLRYAHMKCKYNKATYAFISRVNPQYVLQNDGPFADWVITDPYQWSPAYWQMSLGRLLVSPCDLNEVMLVGYDTARSYSGFYDAQSTQKFFPETLYYSDPLIVHAKQTVSKISGMSIYGLDDKAI